MQIASKRRELIESERVLLMSRELKVKPTNGGSELPQTVASRHLVMQRGILQSTNQEDTVMSRYAKNRVRRGLAREIWSAWMRFGSPRVTIEDQDPMDSDGVNTLNVYDPDSTINSGNDFGGSDKSIA